MPIPASISARRHDSNHLPPSYQDHDPAIKHHDEAPTNPSTQNVPSEPTVQSSLLQPRVAVALGLSAKWHPLLFVCRLLSILPALWWGVPVALRILAQAVVLAGNSSAVWAYAQKTQSIAWLRDYGRLTPDLGSGADSSLDFETRLRMTEMVLGIVWCSSSAYLSFTFTDCLMSRWLLLYTPQATLVRLLTINATNLYLTSQTLHLLTATGSSHDGGGGDDPRLFLPAWITIATTLTGLYHLTQRKINIRKETRLTISVFSVASFVSMVALLAALQGRRGELPAVPAVEMARRVGRAVEAVRARLREWEWGVREEL